MATVKKKQKKKTKVRKPIHQVLIDHGLEASRQKTQVREALATIKNISDEGGKLMLSNEALNGRMRVLVPEAVKNLEELMYSQNESIRLKAITLIISRFVPELRSVEVTNKEEVKGLVIVRSEADNDRLVAVEAEEVN